MSTLYLEIDLDKLNCQICRPGFSITGIVSVRRKRQKGKEKKENKNQSSHHFSCPEQKYLVTTKPSNDRSRFTGLELRELGEGVPL